MTDLVTKARALLQGETLRLIIYGAAIVVWVVSRVLPATLTLFGYTLNFQVVNLDQSLAVATAATVALTELARRYVYSPATVAAIVTTPPTAEGPIAAAEAAGVDTSQPTTPIAVEP